MILRELGFMVYVELPHKYVPNYIGVLRLSGDITQQAWNFANDRLVLEFIIYYLFVFPSHHSFQSYSYTHKSLIIIIVTFINKVLTFSIVLEQMFVCVTNQGKLQLQLSSWLLENYKLNYLVLLFLGGNYLTVM